MAVMGFLVDVFSRENKHLVAHEIDVDVALRIAPTAMLYPQHIAAFCGRAENLLHFIVRHANLELVVIFNAQGAASRKKKCQA